MGDQNKTQNTHTSLQGMGAQFKDIFGAAIEMNDIGVERDLQQTLDIHAFTGDEAKSEAKKNKSKHQTCAEGFPKIDRQKETANRPQVHRAAEANTHPNQYQPDMNPLQRWHVQDLKPMPRNNPGQVKGFENVGACRKTSCPDGPATSTYATHGSDDDTDRR